MHITSRITSPVTIPPSVPLTFRLVEQATGTRRVVVLDEHGGVVARCACHADAASICCGLDPEAVLCWEPVAPRDVRVTERRIAGVIVAVSGVALVVLVTAALWMGTH